MLSYQIHPSLKPAAPYLLLVHGALSNNAQWGLNIEALRQFCTPVMAELLGHGDSPSPQGSACYHPEKYVDYFELIRRELGAERWFVCGYSLGASLTVRYALDHPERVYGHLLTNSNSAFAEAGQMALWAESGAKLLDRSADERLRALAKLPVHPRFATRLPKDVYNPLVARADLLDSWGGSQTLATTTPAASVRERVAENTRPALLLHGVKEKGFAANARFASETMANLQVVELEAGHAVNMQAAAAFNQQVEEFVAAWAT